MEANSHTIKQQLFSIKKVDSCADKTRKTFASNNYPSKSLHSLQFNKKQLNRIKALEYYYKNREKVLKYQSERWKRKYKEDPEFRAKRQLRDKTRIVYGKQTKLVGKCSNCDNEENLQRHHPSYKSIEFIILCKKCHDDLHHPFRKNNANLFLLGGGRTSYHHLSYNHKGDIK